MLHTPTRHPRCQSGVCVVYLCRRRTRGQGTAYLPMAGLQPWGSWSCCCCCWRTRGAGGHAGVNYRLLTEGKWTITDSVNHHRQCEPSQVHTDSVNHHRQCEPSQTVWTITDSDGGMDGMDCRQGGQGRDVAHHVDSTWLGKIIASKKDIGPWYT